MWLFSETGFVSAVQHRDHPKSFIVRGRDRKSLEPLAKFARAKIVETESADYPFRVVVSRKKFGAWVAEQIENLDYTNYKGRMYSTRPEFGNALHNVWDDMHAVSPGRAAVGFGFAHDSVYARDEYEFDFEDEHPGLSERMRNYERDVWGIPSWEGR